MQKPMMLDEKSQLKLDLDNDPTINFTDDEKKLYNDFNEKYKKPLEEEIKSELYNPNGMKYNMFEIAYKQLPESISSALKEVHDRYRVLYFKTKISKILNLGEVTGQLKRDYDGYMEKFQEELPEEFDKSRDQLQI